MNTMINNLFDLPYLDNNINNQNPANPSLMQGFEFTQNQNKFKEGYTSGYEKQYNNSIQSYADFQSGFKDDAIKYSQRVDPKNPLLNKIIRFSTGELSYVTKQGVAKLIPTPEILNSISQKNGCPINDSNSFININIPWSSDYNVEGNQLPTNPPLIIGKRMQLNGSCGYEGSNVFVNSILSSDPKPSYVGCYKDKKYEPKFTKLSGTYNFQQCKDAAVKREYQYYTLNDVDASSKIGNCLVSNDKNTIINNIQAYDFVPLWSSNTSGQSGTYVKLSNDGTLSIRDKDHNVYFSTQSDTSCADISYNLIPNRRAPGYDIDYRSGVTPDDCKTVCNNNSKCAGFTFNLLSNNQCWIKKGGFTNNIEYNKNRNTYQKSVNTSKCKFFLVLQDDGNMCVYRGTPNGIDNFLIWCSDTKGKQLLANKKFVSSKGKYGIPILTMNQILNRGDFICSNSGNLLLKMEKDGNLVLYTFKLSCDNTIDNINYYGKNRAISLYDIGSVGVVSNMGKVGYVDADSQIHTYPDERIEYSNDYNLSYKDSNINGYDLSNTYAKQSNISLSECKNICNDDPDCNAFVYDTTGPSPICLPKSLPDKNMYSPNNFIPSFGKTSFLRDKKIINPPIGIDNKINNIDSVYYNNYGKQGGDLQNSYGLGKLLINNTGEFDNFYQNINKAASQINKNVNNLANFKIEGFEGLTEQDIPKKFLIPVSQTQKFKQKIEQLTENETIVDNILTDTNIKILQKNYSYIAWSILALAVLVVTIKIKNI